MEKPYSEIAKILSEKDPVMKQVIDSVSVEIKPAPSIDIYLELLESIASQQLSIKVVRVIWQRFIDLFADEYPDPHVLLRLEEHVLRKVGLSNSKVKYMKNRYVKERKNHADRSRCV